MTTETIEREAAATEQAQPSTALAVLKKTAMADIVTLAEGLADLQTKYKNVVYAVDTAKGMEEAKAARAAIREPRYKVPHIVKAKKAELKQIGEDIEVYGATFVADCLALETPIHEQIKAQEEIEEAAAAERKRLAEELTARVELTLSMLREKLSAAVGKTAAEIEAIVAHVNELPISTELYGKRAGEVKQVQMQIGESLDAMVLTARANEAQMAELAQLKAAQAERDRADNERREREAQAAAEAQRKADEEAEGKRQAAAREQERAAAEQAKTTKAMEAITRIQGTVGTATRAGTVQAITSSIQMVEAWAPTEESFGFLHQPAILAKDAALSQLRALLAKVEAAAAEAAEQQRQADAAAEADRQRVAAANAEAERLAELERKAQEQRDADAAEERRKQAVALARAQKVATQLVASLSRMTDAVAALTDPEGSLACIPEGPERTELEAAAREAVETLAAAT